MLAFATRIPWQYIVPVAKPLVRWLWRKIDKKKSRIVETMAEAIVEIAEPQPSPSFVTSPPSVVFLTSVMENQPHNPARPWRSRSLAQVTDIVIHHTATSSKRTSFRAIAQYFTGPNHVDSGGCYTIPYHYGIDESGVILLNSLSSVTWCAKNANTRGIHVAILGDFTSKGHVGADGLRPTEAALSKLNNLIRHLSNSGLLPNLTYISTHANFGKPACPGDWAKDLSAILQETLQVTGLQLRK